MFMILDEMVCKGMRGLSCDSKGSNAETEDEFSTPGKTEEFCDRERFVGPLSAATGDFALTSASGSNPGDFCFIISRLLKNFESPVIVLFLSTPFSAGDIIDSRMGVWI